MGVYVLVVRAGHPGGIWGEAFTSYAKGLKYLANYCREAWANQGETDTLPEEDEKAVRDFFDYWSAEGYRWELEKKTLDPE